MGTNVFVSAPSRLHFGLISFGDPTRREFGGVGLMLRSPRVELEVSEAKSLQVAGHESERVATFASRWAEHNDRSLECEIKVTAIIPPHVGLGSGTQMALAVASGLNGYYDLPQPDEAGLAASVNRGLRSAVGTYGFRLGGLIAESGKLDGEILAPLTERITMPEAWRVVMIRPRQDRGLSGEAELKAFRDLPAVPSEISRRLESLLSDEIMPAARSGDFAGFSESVYQYGRLAGECFATCQGGPYASHDLFEIVEGLRELPVAGVGQSSWGPTLFAFSESDEAAQNLVSWVNSRWGSRLQTETSLIDNVGVRILKS